MNTPLHRSYLRGGERIRRTTRARTLLLALGAGALGFGLLAPGCYFNKHLVAVDGCDPQWENCSVIDGAGGKHYGTSSSTTAATSGSTTSGNGGASSASSSSASSGKGAGGATASSGSGTSVSSSTSSASSSSASAGAGGAGGSK